jgi:hypothetical protein
MKAGLVVILAVLSSGHLAAQWLKQPTHGIPRTPDGKPNLTAAPPRAADGTPDLSGLWTKASPKYARNIAADLEPGDIQPWAREVVERRREDLGKDGMQVRCLPLGPAYATSGDSTGSEMVRIIQTPALIVMLNPDLTYRQIWMDGRALEPEPNPSWMGYSVGHWEGDALVVESYGFHPGRWLDRDGNPHTERLRLTERYRRPTFGRLEIDVTFSDPGAYTRSWTVKVGADYAADTEMLEWVCNEGANRSLIHWIGTASDERRNEVAVAPAILARYVGTYVEQPPYWRSVQIVGSPVSSGRTLQITVEDGKIVGNMDDRGRQVLIAASDTEFSGLYGLGVQYMTGGGRRCAPTQKPPCSRQDNQTYDFELYSPSRFGNTGRPTYKPEHWDKVQQLDMWTNKYDPVMTCQPLGVPRQGPPRRIYQTENDVTFLYMGGDAGGGYGEYRVIPTDGRKHDPQRAIETTYMGYTVGRWEGDTLVLDSISFVDTTWLGRGGFFHSSDMHVVERFTRQGDVILYDVTVEDPEVLVEPWVIPTRALRRNTNRDAGLQRERGNCEVYELEDITSQIRH